MQPKLTGSTYNKGQTVASFAQRFVGNPYVWGGTNLNKGADCSGFVKSVYKSFGYNLPRSSSSQRSAGRKVSYSNKQPGDLICYSGAYCYLYRQWKDCSCKFKKNRN